jgi:hypothetical protein
LILLDDDDSLSFVVVALEALRDSDDCAMIGGDTVNIAPLAKKKRVATRIAPVRLSIVQGLLCH